MKISFVWVADRPATGALGQREYVDTGPFPLTRFFFSPRMGEGRLASPNRCALPITALRVVSPNSSAIRLVVTPFSHNSFSFSTLLSVQFIASHPLRDIHHVTAQAAFGTIPIHRTDHIGKKVKA